MGDRFHSAEFTLTLTVLHPKPMASSDVPTTTEKMAIPAHEHDNSNVFNRVLLHPQEVAEAHANVRPSHNAMHVNGATHSTLLIIVICVSFVVLICGVGIARLRNQTQITKGKNKHQSVPKVRKVWQ